MDSETATAVPQSPVSARIEIRGHTLVQDKPPGVGGKDQGPMASELLLSSLLACQLSTFHKIAGKRGVDIAAAQLDGELFFAESGDIERIELLWTLDAAEDDANSALTTLLKLTDKACTISKALQVPVVSSFERSS